MENLVNVRDKNQLNQVSTFKLDEYQRCDGEDAFYQQDSQLLLFIFPNEVWDHIGSLLDYANFHNLNNSSLFFQKLFLRMRSLHLYPLVLKMLIPKLNLYGVLSSRHVCKTWKQAIDKTACTRKPEESKYKNRVQYILSRKFAFEKSTKIDQFLQNFQTSHPLSFNPSPAKYIKVHIHLVEEDYPQFINRISTLYKKYGEHICTFDVSLMFGHDNPSEFHQKFVEWLNCMPNLQNLYLFCYVPLWQNIVEQVSPVELLPTQLQCLRNLAVETFVMPISDEEIPDWSWIERYNFSKLIHSNENLDFLKITMLNKRDVKILENVRSPLKTLIARYFCKEDNVRLAEVFSMFSQKFAKSLETLKLRFRVNSKPFQRIRIMRESLIVRLNLPKVRKFEIEVLSLFCLDFVLGMKENLEELVIICASIGSSEYSDFSEMERGEIRGMERNQIIKFLGYQDKMLESNIWSMLPKLMTINLFASRMHVEFKRNDWMKK